MDLQHACERKFGRWGKCYAKVHRDKNKMPYAFVQFHVRLGPKYECLDSTNTLQEIEDARIAIRDSKGMVIDGRQVRAEHAHADREPGNYPHIS